MSKNPWRMELFGGLRVIRGDKVTTRFRTRQTGLLLAYLALYPDQDHPRDALAEILWPEPEDDVETAKNKLRQALHALRRLLEPPGMSKGSVLRADRAGIGLEPSAFVSDVADFEAALCTADQATDPAEQARLLAAAIDPPCRELLHGYYADWIEEERKRLSNGYQRALLRLVAYFTNQQDHDRALDYAQRLVRECPDQERYHLLVIDLYETLDRDGDALRQYRDLERILGELGDEPSAAARERAEQIRARLRAQEAARPPAQPDHLPVFLTRFFGRDDELADLQTLLSPSRLSSPADATSRVSTRLVTLTGPGGSGKTRLAVEVARRMVDAYEGAVWFVPLADLADARLVTDTILIVVGLQPSPFLSPLDQVVDLFSGRPSLLVLDNFEHLAAEGSHIVETLLKRAPALTCLVTSRRLLGVSGEHPLPVDPLQTPKEAEAVEALSRFASVALFVDRAKAANPKFELSARNAASVAKLCERLDGMPLAIEIVAARAGALTPGQILNRFSGRYEPPPDSSPDRPERHRSLWAAIDWSYHLLSPGRQRLFAHLSVFRGGWTPEAAEAICTEDPREQESASWGLDSSRPVGRGALIHQGQSVVESVDYLRLHSLIVPDEAGEEMRFRMLETLREYAEERLTADERAAMADRHAVYYLECAQEENRNLRGATQQASLQRLEAEHDNLRAALAWCLTSREEVGRGPRPAPMKDESRAQQAAPLLSPLHPFTPSPLHPSNDAGLRLAAALGSFWHMAGHYAEGRKWLAAALAQPEAQERTTERARALEGAGVLAFDQGDYAQSRALLEESLAIFRELGDRTGIGDVLYDLGNTAADHRDSSYAAECFEESLILRKEIGDTWEIAWALNRMGAEAVWRTDPASARTLLEESLAMFQAIPDTEGAAWTLISLGLLISRSSDRVKAREMLEEGLALFRELRDTRGIAASLHRLGNVALNQGDCRSAPSLFEEALAIFRTLGHRQGEASTIQNLGSVAHAQGDYPLAYSLLGESLLLWHELGNQFAVATLLRLLGDLAAAQREWDRAVRLFGASVALLDAIAETGVWQTRSDYEKQFADLDPEVFACTWAQGCAMTVDEAIAYALETKE